VTSGDTLTSIAQKYYGDASKWEKVFDANRDTLPSSNALQVGQKLKIPPQ
jgi:nucleoid-associated protein YgaU